MSNKKRVLFVMPQYEIGGITVSLYSLLSKIDPNRIQADIYAAPTGPYKGKMPNCRELPQNIWLSYPYIGGNAFIKVFQTVVYGLRYALSKLHINMFPVIHWIGGKMYFDFKPYSNLSYIQLINHFVDSSELLKHACEATIAVFPYTDSTQSGCVLTAYTLGIPVITTKSDTMMEIVDEGKSALTVPARNTDMLADAILRLLGDENLQQGMHDYLLNNFFSGERSWDAIADKYLEFYSR